MLRKLFTLVLCLATTAIAVQAQTQTPPNNEIWYATTDGKTVNISGGHDNEVLDNSYRNGVGAIRFKNDVTTVCCEKCYSLKTIIIPNGVTEIGGGAFSGCTNLVSITIPDTVTNIGEESFQGCNLSSIIINVVVGNPSYVLNTLGVDNITAYAGEYSSTDGRCLVAGGVLCHVLPKDLTTFVIPDGMTNIQGYAFSHCKSLVSVTIPESITSIDDFAFIGCCGLTNITIPQSVTSIGYGAFVGCSSLASIDIPDSVTVIGEFAFADCSSLASITIPEGVTHVGDSAFFDCSGLKVLTCKAPIPPRVLPGFLGFADLCIGAETQICVPKKSVKAYKNNYIWGRYAKRIKPIK